LVDRIVAPVADFAASPTFSPGFFASGFFAFGEALGEGFGLVEMLGIVDGADSIGAGDSVTSGFFPPQAVTNNAKLPTSKIRIPISPSPSPQCW
jgi:hypothetical protein